MIHKIKKKKLKIDSIINSAQVQEQNYPTNRSYMQIVEEQSVTNLEQGDMSFKSRRKVKQFSLNQEMKQYQSRMKTPDSLGKIERHEASTNSPKLYNQQSRTKKSSSPQKSYHQDIHNLNSQPVSYKKQFEDLSNSNMHLKQQLTFMNDDLGKKKIQIEKLKVRTAQAQSDKIELMRDLATYESNFAENSGIRSNLMKLYRKVEQVKNQAKANKQEDQGSKDNCWISFKTKDNIFNHLSDLSLLKRERGSISEINGFDIFMPNNAKVNSSKGFNQIYSNKNKRQTTGAQNDLFIYEDQQFISRKISGLSCAIQANIINGVIQIFVTCSFNNKVYKTELKSLNNKQKTQLSREVNRLYFTVDKASTNATKPILILSAREDYEGNTNQSLIQLKGAPSQWAQVTLHSLQQSQIDHKEHINPTQSQNHSNNPNTDMNETVKAFIKVPLATMQYELILQREGRSNEDLVIEIENSYALRQDHKGQLQVCKIEDEIANFIPAQKWLLKIHKNKTISASTVDHLEVQYNENDKQMQKQGTAMIGQRNDIKQNIEERDYQAQENSSDEESDNQQEQRKQIIIQEEFSSIQDSESVSNQSKDINIMDENELEKNPADQTKTFQQLMDYQDLKNVYIDSKRFKSQIFDKEILLKDLHLSQLKSTSQRRLLYQYIMLSKSGSQKFNTKDSKILNSVDHPQLPLTIEDQQLLMFEFFYHYKWYQNNWQYHQLYLQKIAEEEQRRLLEIEMQQQIKLQMQATHDKDQIRYIQENLYKFRQYFKGQTHISQVKGDALLSDDFMSTDNNLKIFIYFFPLDTDSLHLLINKLNVGESINSRRSSAAQGKYAESLVINDLILKEFNLYAYQNIQQVRENLNDFSKLEVLRELIKYQIQAIMNENKQIFKTFEQQQQLNFVQNHPIRKMESEIKNTVRTFGDNKTSSDYGETSMNDSYSKYLKQ